MARRPGRNDSRVEGTERAALVGLVAGRARRLEAERSIEELAGLAGAAGAKVVLRTLQERPKPDPATFLGSGKLKSLAGSCTEMGVDLVVFDNELSPSQLRQITETVGCKVLDRTQLILDIFAARARTREGKLQVELAQLKYLLPRLCRCGRRTLAAGRRDRHTRSWRNEAGNRPATHQDADPRDLRRHRAGQATPVSSFAIAAGKAAVPTVALVGYTNAGKTTLFNRLTKSDATVSDALFVTLDPLLRQVRLPDSRELLISDTVGFIDRLPHALVAAFRATLEEVVEADLALHVIDAAAPDRDRRISAVRTRCSTGGRRAARTSALVDRLQQGGPADTRREAPASRNGSIRRHHLRNDRRGGRRADRIGGVASRARCPARDAQLQSRRRER